jgi:hypothetical protein
LQNNIGFKEKNRDNHQIEMKNIGIGVILPIFSVEIW